MLRSDENTFISVLVCPHVVNAMRTYVGSDIAPHTMRLYLSQPYSSSLDPYSSSKNLSR